MKQRGGLVGLLLLLTLVTPSLAQVPSTTTVSNTTGRLSVGSSSTTSRFSVAVSGQYFNDDAFNAALVRGFAAAAQAWTSVTAVDVSVVYSDIGAPSRPGKAEPQYAPVTSDSQGAFKQLVQRAAREQMKGAEESKADLDLTIYLNTRTPWHVSDGTPPADKYDLSTIVLRELYHGLMFSGFVATRTEGGVKTAYLKGDIPSRFDRFLIDTDGCSILSYLQNRDLEKTLGRSAGELFLQSLRDNRLFIRSDKPRINMQLYAPESFDGRQSVYSTEPAAAGQPPHLMQAAFPAGARVLTVPEDVQALTKLYTGTVGGARWCDNLNNPYPIARRRRVGGLPVWAFGLCLVLLVIVLTGLLFCICTLGARDKQSKQRSCWSAAPCCCSEVDEFDPEAPTFMYAESEHAKRRSTLASLDGLRSSLGDGFRSSLERLRSRGESGAQPMDPAPPPPVAPPLTVEEALAQERSYQLSLLREAGAETQLPARLHRERPV